MLRRDFLKNCLGVLSVTVVGMPSTKKAIPPVKFRKWAKLEKPPTILCKGLPAFDPYSQKAEFGWKVFYVTRILNGKCIDRNFTVKKYA